MGENIPEFDQWINSDEIKKLIKNIAKSLAKKKNEYLLKLFFDSNSIQTGDELVKQLAHELRSFLFEKFHSETSTFKNKLFAPSTNIPAFIKTCFLNSLRDKARHSNVDPMKYLYKRTCDLMRKSETFHIRSIKQPLSFLMIYSMVNENGATVLLYEDDLREIPFLSDIEDRQINKKKIILKLAEYFWNQVTSIWNHPVVWIKVWDFISWINLYVPIQIIKEHKTDKEQTDSDDSIQLNADDILELQCLAEKFCTSRWQLDDKKKAVYVLKHQGMKLREIAEVLGYQSPSGPSYHLKRADEKIQKFLTHKLKSDLTFSDLANEKISLFKEFVLEILKKHE